ncbi:MAG: hypothetical protein JXA71_16635, partial [Chitinispirillaceae bacterium]|nr:hypothetical protein [Chitinispirillaceae bacterium]
MIVEFRCRDSLWTVGMNRVLRFIAVLATTATATPAPSPGGLSPSGIPEALNTITASLPGSSYGALVEDTAAADSVRMRAAGTLADAAFLARDFATARDYYTRAMRFERTPGHYRFRAGCAALAGGDTANAIACFTSVAGTNDDGLA